MHIVPENCAEVYRTNFEISAKLALQLLLGWGLVSPEAIHDPRTSKFHVIVDEKEKLAANEGLDIAVSRKIISQDQIRWAKHGGAR